MAGKPVVTSLTILNDKRLGYSRVKMESEREGPFKSVVSVEYVPVSPAMIGDFTGDSYKLLTNSNGELVGAYLTGTPTAQQIIGKARWLMRVAIATAAGSRSHREAEHAGQVTVRVGRDRVKLGLVQLAFGSTKPAWSGLLTVRVSPFQDAKRQVGFSSPPARVENAIIMARSKFADNYFYRLGETWNIKITSNGKPAYKPGYLWGANRYNSLLSQGAIIEPATPESPQLKTFIPYAKEDGRYRLVDPIMPSKQLLGFTLEILIDVTRLKLIENKDLTRAKAGLALGVLSIVSAPIILGIGKASNRGFGRFRPEDSESINIDILGYKVEASIDLLAREPSRIIEELGRLASKALGLGGAELRGANWTSVMESLIPRLPLEELSTFVGSYRSNLSEGSVQKALDIIGNAARKAQWKKDCGRGFKAKGHTYHTWPLGLPRRGKIRGRFTGYMLKVGDKTSEGRRQSFIVAYSLDGRTVYTIGFPSGDLNRIMEKLQFLYLPRGTKYVKVIPVRNIKYAKLIIKPGNCINVELPSEADKRLREILKITYNNFSLAIR